MQVYGRSKKQSCLSCVDLLHILQVHRISFNLKIKKEKKYINIANKTYQQNLQWLCLICIAVHIKSEMLQCLKFQL